MTIPANVVGAVVSRLKTLARVGTAVRNRPQEGVFTFQVSGRRVDVRLSTVPTAAGEKLRLKMTDKQRQLLAIDALGYDPEMLGRLTRVLDEPRGFVLMTGPNGCGIHGGRRDRKSTRLNSSHTEQSRMPSSA